MTGIRSGIAGLRGSRFARPEPEHPPEAVAPRGPIWVVTPCKGRLRYLQQALGRVMAHPEVHCCIVDYSCPDRVGDWVEAEFASEVAAGRLVVERVPDQPVFNKCRAHNAGARRARRQGADFFCFLDADTLVEPGFYDHIRAQARGDRFLIAGLREDGSDQPSMTGLLVVRAEAFEQVGGFDEGFLGWGGEDIEFRLRLFLLGGLEVGEVPLSLVRPMEHDDQLRSRFYQERDIVTSNSHNMARIHGKFSGEWRGRMVRSPSSAERLWFKHVASFRPFVTPEHRPVMDVPVAARAHIFHAPEETSGAPAADAGSAQQRVPAGPERAARRVLAGRARRA
jgi:hypothetical protein